MRHCRTEFRKQVLPMLWRPAPACAFVWAKRGSVSACHCQRQRFWREGISEAGGLCVGGGP